MPARAQKPTHPELPDGGNQPILEARDISKSFPGVKALDRVNFQLFEGEILGLVGENGAGKSTLMKILSGVYSPDEGEIILRGDCLTCRNSLEAASAGIGMVHQELSLLPNLTVAENIYLGRENRFIKWGVINWKKMYAAAQKRLDQLGFSMNPKAVTQSIPFSERQMVEIARVISLEDELQYKPIIILDEPTTNLSAEEVDNLFAIMKHLAEIKYSIIFISHRLEEILEITQKIVVLKDGQLEANLVSSGIDAPKLQQLMVGREMQTEYYQESKQIQPESDMVLQIENLSKQGTYKNITFDLHRREILGLAGVVGSGIRELTRTLFGVIAPDSGSIHLNGDTVKFRNPSDAINKGIGYIPEERGDEGLILYFSPAPNITLPHLNAATRAGFLSPVKEGKICNRWVDELNIKVPTRQTMCGNLSGGNQQKVVISKWLETNVDILIMDHPTRGIDVGAKEEVYALIRQLTGQGISIILIADSLEELIGLSNTILIMKDGELTKSMPSDPGAKPTPQDLIRYMV